MSWLVGVIVGVVGWVDCGCGWVGLIVGVGVLRADFRLSEGRAFLMPNIVATLAEHTRAALVLDLARFGGGHLCVATREITTIL